MACRAANRLCSLASATLMKLRSVTSRGRLRARLSCARLFRLSLNAVRGRIVFPLNLNQRTETITGHAIADALAVPRGLTKTAHADGSKSCRVPRECQAVSEIEQPLASLRQGAGREWGIERQN